MRRSCLATYLLCKRDRQKSVSPYGVQVLLANRCSNRPTFPLQLYLPAFGILLLASDCKAFLRCFHSAARKYYSFAFELPGCAFYLPIMSAEASFPGQDSRFISIFALSPDTTFSGFTNPFLLGGCEYHSLFVRVSFSGFYLYPSLQGHLPLYTAADRCLWSRLVLPPQFL